MSKSEKTIIWCDKIMAFSFYALIYFLPISIALAETFTVMALVSYMLKRGVVFWVDSKGVDLNWHALSFSKNRILFFLKCFKPVGNYLNTPIAVFLLINFISAVVSQRPSVSWPGFFGKTLQSAFIYFNFVECINTKKRLKIFLNVFFVSCTLICVNGIYQSFSGHGFIRGYLVDERISSSLRHANDFGAYLVVVIFILWGSVLAFVENYYRTKNHQLQEPLSKPFMSGRDGILSFILFGVAFTCLGLTYSRGAWVGFLLAIICLGFWRKKILFINCFIVILFLCIFYPKLNQERNVGFVSESLRQKAYIEKIKIEKLQIKKEKGEEAKIGITKLSDEPSYKQEDESKQKPFHVIQWEKISKAYENIEGSGRRAYWQEAINMIKDYPVLGVGINAYSLIAPRYKITWGGYPHNSYLQMTAETGLVGIATFFWILIVLFRESFRILKQIGSQPRGMLFLGFLTGFLGFLIHSFFDTNFYSVQLGSLMWIIMGAIVAIPKIETT